MFVLQSNSIPIYPSQVHNNKKNKNDLFACLCRQAGSSTVWQDQDFSVPEPLGGD